MENKLQKIKCINPNCKEAKEFVYLGEDKGLTIVNESGDTVYDHSEYTYKCRNCNTIFKSSIPPAHKRILHN